MDTHSFTFISQGKVPENISIAVRNAVASAQGERLKLTIGKAKNYSSDPQRKYYFAVIIPHIQGLFLTGGGKFIDDVALHDWLMWEVGQWTKTIRGYHGELIKVRRSYMDLSTGEAEEHHAKCIKWAAERGCQIPLPNEI